MFGYSFVDEKTNEKTKQIEETTWFLTRINAALERDNIFSLEYRIVYKIILFIHKIMNDKDVPISLKSCLGKYSQSNDFHLLRSSLEEPKVRKIRSLSKYGDLIFQNFDATLINEFTELDFSLEFAKFKESLLSKFNLIYEKFIYFYKNFDIMVDLFIFVY